MAENEQPQTYLISLPEFELSSYADLLSRMLDLHEIACVRLAMSTRDEGMIGKAAIRCAKFVTAAMCRWCCKAIFSG